MEGCLARVYAGRYFPKVATDTYIFCCRSTAHPPAEDNQMAHAWYEKKEGLKLPQRARRPTVLHQHIRLFFFIPDATRTTANDKVTLLVRETTYIRIHGGAESHGIPLCLRVYAPYKALKTIFPSYWNMTLLILYSSIAMIAVLTRQNAWNRFDGSSAVVRDDLGYIPELVGGYGSCTGVYCRIAGVTSSKHQVSSSSPVLLSVRTHVGASCQSTRRQGALPPGDASKAT